MAERARARTNPHNSGFGPSSDNKATSALPDPHRGAQHGPRAALTPPSSPGPRPPQPGPDPRSCSRRASSAANHQSRGVEEGLGGGGVKTPQCLRRGPKTRREAKAGGSAPPGRGGTHRGRPAARRQPGAAALGRGRARRPPRPPGGPRARPDGGGGGCPRPAAPRSK